MMRLSALSDPDHFFHEAYGACSILVDANLINALLSGFHFSHISTDPQVASLYTERGTPEQFSYNPSLSLTHSAFHVIPAAITILLYFLSVWANKASSLSVFSKIISKAIHLTPTDSSFSIKVTY